MVKASKKSLWEEIYGATRNLPMFDIHDIAALHKNRASIRMTLSRHKKSGDVVPLKRGLYVLQAYLDKAQKQDTLDIFRKFLACALYEPSYLSLEYVLDEHGIVTESERTFTLVTMKKTSRFTNRFGTFRYYSVRPDLYTGYVVRIMHGFFIAKASLAKALFDFLYVRKDVLYNRESVRSLRLNLDRISRSDKRKLERYVRLEGSRKMSNIFLWLFS